MPHIWDGEPDDVSIRSPRRSEGRFIGMGAMTSHLKFQSAPPAEARGDLVSFFRLDPVRRFNPLPPPKRGEMANTAAVTEPGSGVSIRSPRRSEGRSYASLISNITKVVSIRSPRRSEGRCSQTTSSRKDFWRFNPLPPPKRGEIKPVERKRAEWPGFQSAPPAEARGD